MAVRQSYSAESLAQSTTTSTSPQTKVTLSETLDANSTYWIIGYCMVSNSSNLYRTDAELYDVTNTTILMEHDSRFRDDTDYTPQLFYRVITTGGSPEAREFSIRYHTENASGTAEIKEARLYAVKLTTDDQTAYAAGPTTNNDSGTWTTMATKTFTATAGNHVVLTSMAFSQNSSAKTDMRIFVNGTTAYRAAAPGQPDFSMNWIWAPAPIVINLSAGSNTIAVQMKSVNGSPFESTAKTNTLLIFPLATWGTHLFAESNGTSTTTPDTTSDDYRAKVTLTGTPSAQDYFVISGGILSLDSTTTSVRAQVTDEAVEIVDEMIQEPDNTVNDLIFSQLFKATYTAAERDWLLNWASETNGREASIDEAAILVLPLEVTAGGGGGTAVPVFYHHLQQQRIA